VTLALVPHGLAMAVLRRQSADELTFTLVKRVTALDFDTSSSISA
jgi:hypothetical protein